MATFKSIVCVQSSEKYKSFIAAAKMKIKDLVVAEDLSILYDTLLCDDNITVIFIDYLLLDKITDRLSSILSLNNNICIALFEEYTDKYKRHPYIYDILECKNIYNINNFFIRLEKDINCRLQLISQECELKKFYEIAKNLSAEKDIEAVMELFIDACMEITSADAGTIYLVVDGKDNQLSTYEGNARNRFLKFAIAKNKSMKLDLKSTVSPISRDSVFGYVVITGQPVRINDAYNIPGDADYHFNANFDKATGYRTTSILAIPMKDHYDRILGVVQLINKKDSGKIIPFNSRDEMIVYSLAGQAAVVMENNALYRSLNYLLEEQRLIVSEEIVKRKRANEEINKLLSAIEHSPVSVIITDVDGRIEYVNPKFSSITGYTYNEVVGRTPRIFKSGIHPREFYEDLWNTILSGKEWYGEFYNKKKNGEFYWESASISALKGEDGSIKYFITIKEDITEKKQIYKKLEEKNIKLEETIRELNKAQSQLVQKEKMAAIGQLAAGVAHEINNPLGFVMSNYMTLQRYISKFKELLLLYENLKTNYINKGHEDVKTLIDCINIYESENKIKFLIDDLPGLFADTSDGLERVKNIVSALRTFSHIDQINNFEEYDVNAGIKTTLLIAHNYIKYAAINEDFGELPPIIAAGGEINQAILNIILNAAYAIKLKNSCEPGIIDIKTYQREKYVYIEITDNGIGIDKENLNRIFEPFYSTKPVGEGTGLGLSISYDIIVKKHKGEIFVDSKSGYGTKFTIKLPFNQFN